MEKVFDRAKSRFRGLAHQMEGTLKGVTYKADMAAKNVVKIVKGILNGQHKL